MKKVIVYLLFFVFICSCKTTSNVIEAKIASPEMTIAFGSCNKATLDNFLWDDVIASQPDVWIWGGDIIYADTDDPHKIASMYKAQNAVKGYQELKRKVPVIGAWDDHDYGLNDGGIEFAIKKESQQVFLDFMEVPKNSNRRKQEGIYTSHTYELEGGKVKVIVLDTRYFRTALTPDTETKKRNKPNVYGEGSMLGEEQWKWLVSELTNSDADFNLIVSSIQFLSNEHGFECWGNFPHEVDRLKKEIAVSKAKGVLILSGDRHISEFSKTRIEGVAYPLIDFTSSGLTHAYSGFSGEPNPYRIGEVVSIESFGWLQINMKTKQVVFKMLGDDGEVLGTLEEKYE